MSTESFEELLTGGHPNSLGNTESVAQSVLDDASRLEELYQCYFSQDEVVRLRTSEAIKRVCKAQPEWLVPYIDRLLTEVSKIDQASTQWTLAILFDELAGKMSKKQRLGALSVMKSNLERHHDWIVLITTIDTLERWAQSDATLATWMLPHLARHATDARKSVSRRAAKARKALAT